MHTDPNAPASTRMMSIVHQALRRDLERARSALTSAPGPGDRQRIAIARHVRWMMGFLEAHHRSEDLGLYPAVRARRPEAGDLLDDMAADHAEIAIAVAGVETAAAACERSDERGALVVALERLDDVLLPHLRREEDEAMPVVSMVLNNAEWDAIEREHSLDGKSLRQLGFEGHWLIDEAGPDDRRQVVELVPPVPRLVLLHGFGPSYRRHRRGCWDPPRRVQKAGTTAVVVDAAIDDVWDLLRDVTRVGEWSHECVSSHWLDGATEARPGARFRGLNRQGLFRWGRCCEVVKAEPYELVWRTVPTTFYPDSTEWAIRLERDGDGTRVTQTFEVLRAPALLDLLYAMLVPAHRDRCDALADDLRRLGLAAQRDAGNRVAAAGR